MRAVIIDDEVLNIKNLQQLLAKHCPEVAVVGQGQTFAEGYQLLRTIDTDIVFLDILMPPHTGFDLLTELGSYDFELIFITAHSQYGIEAIKCSALDYLLKPINVSELKKAIKKAASKRHQKQQQDQIQNLLTIINHPQKSTHRIALHLMNEIKLVPTTNILCLKSDNSYTQVYLQGHPKPLIVTTPLFEFDTLLASYHFIRTHQSWLVNQHHVKSIVRKDGIYELLLTDGMSAQVARAKKEVIKKLLLNR